MMKETELYKRLLRVTPGFHWQRHEDKYARGIPDCSYGVDGVCGWIELKTYDCWPRDKSSPLKFTDLKPEQVNWLMERGKACGRCWILLWVGDDWLLIQYNILRKLSELNEADLKSMVDAWGTKKLSPEISKILSS